MELSSPTHQRGVEIVATSELEAQPIQPSAIVGRRFRLARKGYDPAEVDQFLRQLSEVVARLQGEVEWQRARGEHLERRTTAAQEAAYARLSRDFMDVVRRADEAASRVRTDAEAQARAEIGAAHKKAARLLSAAVEQAEAMLTQARAEAERIMRRARSANGSTATDQPAELSLEPVSPEPTRAWSPDFESPISGQPHSGVWDARGGTTPARPSDQAEDDLAVDIDVSLFELFDTP
jgi:DivIVA domain-containing protein